MKRQKPEGCFLAFTYFTGGSTFPAPHVSATIALNLSYCFLFFLSVTCSILKLNFVLPLLTCWWAYWIKSESHAVCFVLITCVFFSACLDPLKRFHGGHVVHLSSVCSLGHLSSIRHLYLCFIGWRTEKDNLASRLLVHWLTVLYSNLRIWKIGKERAGLLLAWSKWSGINGRRWLK